MEIMIIPIIVIGLASSIVTELFKLFPFLTVTKERQRAVAFLIALFISICYVLSQAEMTAGGVTAVIVGSLGMTFAVYKSLIQPIKSTVLGIAKFCARPKKSKPEETK